ncbi:ABC transporter substrate-binding protein [Paenibacillus sp. JDR-2]|uniref:ABC transporter substrate-binding protein n=1 Tax=Paenibacillus sp. (strain JDR-2) TaxID=324057 RepID=UPI0005A095F5|nr:ABC transporter substrate-binding protein [Paenibacillus sp. JDR-2]
MRKKKSTIMLLLMALVIVLSACGQNNNKTSGNNGAASPAAEQSGGSGAAATDAVPKIASLSIHVTNDLLALDITAAGSVMGGKAKDFLSHVADRLKNTEKLGVAKEVDMEALLQLEPDIIYADEEFAGQDTSKLEAIAPVKMFNLDEGTWRDHLKKLAADLGREQKAEQFIADYEEQVKRVKSLIQAKLGDNPKAMAIRVTPKELRVFGTPRPLGPILFDDLGFQPASGVEKINSSPYEVISQEVLPDFDADVIFVVVNEEADAKKVYDEMQSSPIWKGLKAVKNGNVYVIGEQPWLDYSAIGNKMALDEAEAFFAK